MEVDTSGISCCFDEESRDMLDDYRKNGLSDTAETIRSALISRGLSGLTSLEIGCGVGALTLQLVKDGVSSASGFDLSPNMVKAANSLASEMGLSSSVSFRLGDGAKEALGKADLVILDTVLCCYPQVSALLDSSSSAAKRYYAISIPDDRRIATKVLRVFLPLANFFGRRKFRFYVHPTRTIASRLEGDGFSRTLDSKVGWIWTVMVFSAPGTSAAFVRAWPRPEGAGRA